MNEASKYTSNDAGVGAQVSPLALTVPEFCEAHRISRALFYLMLRDGRGPRVMKCGKRTLVSSESAQAWRRQMEVA